jgi:hypothetical protein
MNDDIIIFPEDIKKLRHFTKKNEQTWHVQKNKDSNMESFYVTLIPGGLVMYGDYDGIIVNPYTRNDKGTINWMSNATCLGYFAEKVKLGNQYHKTTEYSEAYGEKEIIREIAMHCEMDGAENFLKEQIWNSRIDDEQFKENIKKEFGEDISEEKLDELIKIRDTIAYHSLENECQYWDLCQTLESEHDFSDMWETRPHEYTDQIKWQHQCLLWWANNVRDKKDLEYFKVE